MGKKRDGEKNYVKSYVTEFVPHCLHLEFLFHLIDDGNGCSENSNNQGGSQFLQKQINYFLHCIFHESLRIINSLHYSLTQIKFFS